MVNPRKNPPPVRRQKSRAPFYIALAVIFVGGASALGYMASKPKNVAYDVDPGTPLPDAKGHTIGNAAAPITVVEFGDFECPSCGQFAT